MLVPSFPCSRAARYGCPCLTASSFLIASVPSLAGTLPGAAGLGGLAETLVGRELGGAAYGRQALGELLAAQVVH